LSPGPHWGPVRFFCFVWGGGGEGAARLAHRGGVGASGWRGGGGGKQKRHSAAVSGGARPSLPLFFPPTPLCPLRTQHTPPRPHPPAPLFVFYRSPARPRVRPCPRRMPPPQQRRSHTKRRRPKPPTHVAHDARALCDLFTSPTLSLFPPARSPFHHALSPPARPGKGEGE